MRVFSVNSELKKHIRFVKIVQRVLKVRIKRMMNNDGPNES